MRKAKSVLEIMRMSVYVFFPVAVFYVFNHPDFFDKFVEEKRKVFFPEGNVNAINVSLSLIHFAFNSGHRWI
eukprot:m.6227 g.6227  ORF g.6227 m.6227 type:complete len:72 (+) comp15311_c0_seq1:70-285(+)